jgi:tetratricopeptide (TPR) repeat protein
LNALAKLGASGDVENFSFAFKGKNSDIRAIGEQLGARYVLEGSVRKSGERLRITAQLIDAREGHHLWSERYDRDMRDVFAVQDEITAAIRDALSERLLGIGPASAAVAPAIDPQTYELFLRGRYLIERRLEGPEAATRIMEQVVERAPRYAPAYIELATAHKMRIFYCSITAREGWPLVRSLAERAAEIDAEFAPALCALAEVAFYGDWDWAKARELYERSLVLDPNDSDTLASLGMYWASLGRFDQSMEVIDQAVSLDPLNPAVLVRQMLCQHLCRRYEDAIATCDRTIELVPDFSESYRWKGMTQLFMGRVDEAVASLEMAVARSGRHIWSISNLARALIAAERLDDARLLVDEAERRSATEVVPAMR